MAKVHNTQQTITTQWQIYEVGDRRLPAVVL